MQIGYATSAVSGTQGLETPRRKSLLFLRVFLGLVDAFANPRLVTLATGAFLRLGMLLAHDENPSRQMSCNDDVGGKTL